MPVMSQTRSKRIPIKLLSRKTSLPDQLSPLITFFMLIAASGAFTENALQRACRKWMQSQMFFVRASLGGVALIATCLQHVMQTAVAMDFVISGHVFVTRDLKVQVATFKRSALVDVSSAYAFMDVARASMDSQAVTALDEVVRVFPIHSLRYQPPKDQDLMLQ